MAQFYQTKINNVFFEIQTNTDDSIYMRIYTYNPNEFVGFDTTQNDLKQLRDFLNNYFS